MSVLSLIKPIIGKPDAQEDVKIVNAFTAIENWANGEISASNLAEFLAESEQVPEGLLSAAVKVALAERAGLLSQKSIIATEQSRENAAFGLMATPDEVTVTLPTNGLIAVAYQAVIKEIVAEAARAALFIGGNQLVIASGVGVPKMQAAATKGVNGGYFVPVFSHSGGLASTTPDNIEGYTGDVTTGQAVGYANPTSFVAAQELGASGYAAPVGTALAGPCYIFASAGTYKVSVQFKASSNKVTVKNRKLWAWIIA